jgi:hypothetical protein
MCVSLIQGGAEARSINTQVIAFCTQVKEWKKMGTWRWRTECESALEDACCGLQHIAAALHIDTSELGRFKALFQQIVID